MRWASTSLCIYVLVANVSCKFHMFFYNFVILQVKSSLMWVAKKCWRPILQWSESQDVPFWSNWYCKCLWGFGWMIGWNCSIFTTGQATGTLSSTSAHDWFLSFCWLYSMHHTFLSLQALGLVVAVVWVSWFLPFKFWEFSKSLVGYSCFVLNNWNINGWMYLCRVTCRDWFQLSLKEGLTVFRDQVWRSYHFASPSILFSSNATVINPFIFQEL